MPRWCLLALLVLAACPPPCDRSTCVGCCDSAGECFGGANRRACGRAASICQVCEGEARCVLGRCVQPQGDAGTMEMIDAGPVELCAHGCRDALLGCQPGNLPEACGVDGGVCVDCGGAGRCERGRCVGATCPGCIDAVGTCQLGTDDFNCGSGSGLCRTCAATERCSNMTCVPLTCSVSTCPTCCQGTSCLPASNTSCGINGSMCVACPTGTSCVGGVCR